MSLKSDASFQEPKARPSRLSDALFSLVLLGFVIIIMVLILNAV